LQQTDPHLANNKTVPNGTEPVVNDPSNPGNKSESPTDKFKDLWNTSNQPTNQAPNFKLDPTKLAETLNTMNFTKNIPREELSKIAQGGEAAIEALGNVLNSFGREVFGASAQFSSHMTESGYQSASKVIDTGLPGAIKRQLTEQQLFQSNPKLKDPALQPLIGALQSQFTTKFPNASPTEIQDLVAEYMTTVVGGAFAKEEPAAQQTRGVQQQDFSSFLN